MMKKFVLIISCLLLPTLSFAGQITLETAHFNMAGQKTIVTIVADSLNSEIGGFQFVFALDETKYSFLSLKAGTYLDSCGWEYLTWQIHHNQDLSYSIAPATALLEINGLASLNGTAPSCAIATIKKELVQLELQLTNQPIGEWDAETVFLHFYWRDCQDNLIFSKNLDTAFTANSVFMPVAYYDGMIEELLTSFPGYGLVGANCDTVSEYVSIANLQFINGWYEATYDHFSFGLRGDLNLDGVQYGISDMVLFINYFTYGLPVFITQSPYWESSIAASDINADSRTLSVDDLVYGIRILTADVTSYNKLIANPILNNTNIITSKNNSELSLNSTNSLDAVYLKFVTDNKQILTKDDFSYLPESAKLGNIGDTTTILMVNLDGTQIFDAGENKLFESHKTNYTVTHFEAVDIYGQTTYNRKLIQLPVSFELFQNYPNPFNPTTVIKANLPEYSAWSLEIVSITGQTVRTFDGIAQGILSIEWDGTDAQGTTSASGVYLYRFTANGMTDSKKMLLLK